MSTSGSDQSERHFHDVPPLDALAVERVEPHSDDENEAPTTMLCIGESTPSSTMPDCSDCISSAPSIAPMIVPEPPASDVPPMTAAAITSNSSRVPSELVAELRRADEIAALIVASMPMMMNTFMRNPARIDAGEACGFRVAADRKHIAAEPRAAGDEGHDDTDGDSNQHRDGDAVSNEQAALGYRDIVGLGVFSNDADGQG